MMTPTKPMPHTPLRPVLGWLLPWLLLWAVAASAQGPGPAEISLRRADGESLSVIELGDQVEFEVVIDAGSEELTGFAFYLSFDSDVFRLLEPSGLRTVDSVEEPFVSGGWLDGVVLLNRVEQEEGVTYLAYAEAAGVQRRTATDSGVAATFRLEAVRRPLGDRTEIAVEERGHDRRSHYTTTAAPGAELDFGQPLGSASLRVGGFRIASLPSVTVVEGDGPQEAYADLDTFAEQVGATVIWSASFVNGLGTAIDADHRVIMDPVGLVGDTTVVFTAFEVEEGNSDADTVDVRILGRPRITGLTPTVTFVEDGSSAPLALDDFVTDLDTPDAQLTWTPTNGSFIHVDIDAATRVATFSADPDSFGESQVQLAVSDSTGLADSVLVRVVVTPVNDPPVVQRLQPVYPRLGAGGSVVVPLSELIVDADDPPDSLQILLQTEGGITAQLTADGQGLELSGTAAGRGLVRITAQDGDGEVSEGRLVAVVLEEGTTVGPEIAPLPLLRFTAGTPGTLDLNALVDDDSADNQLTWTAASFDELLPVVTEGVLLVSAAQGFTGPAAVGLIVTDPDGNQDSGSLAVEVLPAGQPQAPQISAPAKVGLSSGPVAGGAPTEVVLQLDRLVSDPDHNDDDIAWTTTASSGLVAELDEATRQVRLSAPEGLPHVASLTLTATDPDGQSATESIPVLVVHPSGPPLVDELQEVSLDSAGTVGRIDLDDVAFDDEDFESELEWSVQAEPGIVVSLDPVTHLLRVRRDDGATGTPPSEARVLLTATDTRGQQTSAILNVALPPVFQLDALPEIVLYAGGVDTSLVLDDYVERSPTALLWSVQPAARLDVTLDQATTRVRIAAPSSGFIGSEIVTFRATDGTGRSRTAPLRVVVRGRGLAPQVRTFPVLRIPAGEVDRSIDLDDYVVDDDPDSTLRWSVGQPLDVVMSVDPLTHELTVQPQSTASGPRTAQLLVRDPAGNTALGVLEMQIVRGGEPPVVGPLPQILLPAGGEEQALSLDLYVSDPDNEPAEIRWTVNAEPGVAARIDAERRLFVSVPAGQQGSRQVLLVAEDPQGNRDEGTLVILVQQDDEPPTFALVAQRNDVVSDLLDIVIEPSEPLDAPPEVTLNGSLAEVTDLGDGTYSTSFAVPPVDTPQSVRVEVSGKDRAGNPGERRLDVALRRLADEGGRVAAADGQATVTVPGNAARSGRMAVVYRLGDADRPPGAGDDPRPIYRAAVDGGGPVTEPVTLNLFAGSGANDPELGIERWEPHTGLWEDVPTAADPATGWMSVAVDEPGLYRVGPVAEGQRRAATSLTNYPNPFRTDQAPTTRIEYEVTRPGPVRLEVYNSLGQSVRLLVDDPFQDVGMWTSTWDGRDGTGRLLATGVYFYELRTGGVHRLQSLLLVK